MRIDAIPELFERYAYMPEAEKNSLTIDFPEGAPRSYEEAISAGAVPSDGSAGLQVASQAGDSVYNIITMIYYEDDRKITARLSDTISVDFFIDATLILKLHVAMIAAMPVPGLIAKNSAGSTAC